MSSEPYWPPSLYDLGYSIKVSVFCPMLLPNLLLPPFESEIEYSIRTMIPDIKSQLSWFSTHLAVGCIHKQGQTVIAWAGPSTSASATRGAGRPPLPAFTTTIIWPWV